ncbi:hypothetical protein CARUB_v10001126mg [Capsella rubella]|uniref:DUF155 domain-containing protein n=1 Tax=Capsella rubella TaxID=81985 RepID=R0H7E1_9BRAS|nr:uncharacterized protein LOC17881220 [Capsella rubella]EOA20790.1 hypothetical protein CARUB_v10001126mg [Capsella rubella]
MMRSIDVYVKTVAPPVRSILFSIFTSKQKSPSLSLPLHLSLRSFSVAPSRYFSNVLPISNSPIWGFRAIRNHGSLFSVRAISSSTTASVDLVQQQSPTLVDDENRGSLEEAAKPSIPVRAYFFSTSVNLRSLIEQNKQNFIPPTSRTANCAVLKFGNHSDPTGTTAGCISWTDCIYMVVYQYGSIVLFNVREHEVDEYLKLVERHAYCLLPEMKIDEYEVREDLNLETWMEPGPDFIMLQFLNSDGIRTIGSVLGLSIALDHYDRQVDGILAEFTNINSRLEGTGTFTMDKRKLFQLVGKANSNLADVILKLRLFERLDIAWKDAKYDQIWEFLRAEFELTRRFASLDYKLKIVEHNVSLLLGILQNRKSNFLEWLIVILICTEIVITVYNLARTSL